TRASSHPCGRCCKCHLWASNGASSGSPRRAQGDRKDFAQEGAGERRLKQRTRCPSVRSGWVRCSQRALRVGTTEPLRSTECSVVLGNSLICRRFAARRASSTVIPRLQGGALRCWLGQQN